REALTKPNLLAPARSQVERNLTQANGVLDEVAGLFEKYRIGGDETAPASMRGEICAYKEFVSREGRPRGPVCPRRPPGSDRLSAAEHVWCRHAALRIGQSRPSGLS